MDPREKLIHPPPFCKGTQKTCENSGSHCWKPSLKLLKSRQLADRSPPGQLRKNTLYKLTPPALGTEPSSLLSFTISSGRKRIFLAIGPEYKNKAT